MKKSPFTDEMAEKNEGKASNFSLAVTALVTIISGAIIKAVGADPSIAIDILLMTPYILWATRDGLYLYFERQGVLNADVEN